MSLALLRTELETAFVLDARGRILACNDPERTPGPLFAMAGCVEGNLALVRHDLEDAAAAEMLALASALAPWHDAWRFPEGTAALIDRLAATGCPGPVRPGLIYALAEPRLQGASGPV